jgi:hypothetical protein
MNSVLHLLTPRRIAYNKLRLGNNSDGGYVVFNYNISRLQKVYSYGIGANVTFENDLIRLMDRNGVIYMYDHTINCVPGLEDPKRMFWFKQPASSWFLPAQINLNGDSCATNMLLKMDIDGGEWNLLNEISNDTLCRVSQIVIELHYVHEADIRILEKINNLFYLGHIHGNNHGGIKDGLPDVVECTYIRKDCLSELPDTDISPYPKANLDYPNDPMKPDFELNYWYKI